jgi:hypothetical protein
LIEIRGNSRFSPPFLDEFENKFEKWKEENKRNKKSIKTFQSVH